MVIWGTKVTDLSKEDALIIAERTEIGIDVITSLALLNADDTVAQLICLDADEVGPQLRLKRLAMPPGVFYLIEDRVTKDGGIKLNVVTFNSVVYMMNTATVIRVDVPEDIFESDTDE